MKIFVTGVSGQLGHDVIHELAGRGYEAVGSDIQPQYAGIADASAGSVKVFSRIGLQA